MIDVGRLIIPLAVAAAVFASLYPVPAAALTANEVRQRIAAQYGVKVLKVRRSRLDGVAVFLVTVMNPPGDFNEAFRITTLAVNVATGKPVSAFRHLPSGRRDSQSISRSPNRQPADALRRGFSWR